MSKKIVSVNTGSSSLKLSVADVDSLEILFNGEKKNVKNFMKSTEELIDELKTIVDLSEIVAIGHRIVHGGSQSQIARRIDDEVLNDMYVFADFDPMHSEAALALVHAMKELFPNAEQIACFDTAFFHDIPKVAQTIALPRKYQEKGIRRYGFHGLSYNYVLGELRKDGVPVDNENIIIAHLGSGASLAAIKNGRPVDTTMGFTPTSGIVMSSRTGDIDPGLIGFLNKQFGMTIEEWTNITNKESGILGVSDLSADMYTLIQAEKDNPHAKEATELFVYKVRQAVGSLAASMNGVDRLVFTGGIGEASSVLRERILDGLTFLGIKEVHVVATNENTVILKNIQELLNN